MKDRIVTENITIAHCPTEEMLADFFTKPLQGSLFRKFRAVLLGHDHISTLIKTPPVPLEERVENRILNQKRPGTDGQTLQSRTKRFKPVEKKARLRPTYASMVKKSADGLRQ